MKRVMEEKVGYPGQEELLKADPLLEWIDEEFLRADPYAFEGIGFRPVVRAFAEGMGIDPNGVYCIGSGAIGLSLNPANIRDGRLAKYDHRPTAEGGSDLDIALISEVYFEVAWRDVRRAAQPTLGEIEPLVQDNLSWQKKKFFDGAILTNKLLPILSFGAEWITASNRVNETVAKLLDREVDVNYWIYRDYWSVRNYVSIGLSECRKKLLAE